MSLLLLPGPLAAQDRGETARSGVALELFAPEDTDNRDIHVAMLSLEFERPLPARFWLRGAAGVAFTRGRLREGDPGSPNLEADGVGLGLAGSLRWRLVEIGRIAPFVEAGVGMLLTTERFPPGGTVWNFSPRYGAGLDVRVGRRLRVAVAYRNIHFSNGKGFGHPDNPSYDGSGVVVAVSR